MRFDASDAQVKRAQFPHNLMIAGLFAFNIFMAPALFVLNVGMLGLLIPLFCSSALIAYLHLRGKFVEDWFCKVHWRMALAHSKWLMLGYAVTALLILLAWFASQATHEASMKHILWTALTRIALLPSLIGVMIAVVMEAGAISLASKRELSAQMLEKYPPPER